MEIKKISPEISHRDHDIFEEDSPCMAPKAIRNPDTACSKKESTFSPE